MEFQREYRYAVDGKPIRLDIYTRDGKTVPLTPLGKGYRSTPSGTGDIVELAYNSLRSRHKIHCENQGGVIKSSIAMVDGNMIK